MQTLHRVAHLEQSLFFVQRQRQQLDQARGHMIGTRVRYCQAIKRRIHPLQDVIEAKATQGAQIKKTFGESSSWTLADMTQTVAGQDVPQELPDIAGEHRLIGLLETV